MPIMMISPVSRKSPKEIFLTPTSIRPQRARPGSVRKKLPRDKDSSETVARVLREQSHFSTIIRVSLQKQPDFHPAALHSRSKKQIYLLLCFPAELHSLDIKPDLISDTGYVFAVGRSGSA